MNFWGLRLCREFSGTCVANAPTCLYYFLGGGLWAAASRPESDRSGGYICKQKGGWEKGKKTENIDLSDWETPAARGGTLFAKQCQQLKGVRA